MSCHSSERVAAIAPEVEAKVDAMTDVIKSYKKLVFKAESELKKDRKPNISFSFGHDCWSDSGLPRPESYICI